MAITGASDDPIPIRQLQRVTRRGTTIEIDSETGLPLIVQTQDLKPIIEANKRQASSFDKHQARASPTASPTSRAFPWSSGSSSKSSGSPGPEGAQCLAR